MAIQYEMSSLHILESLKPDEKSTGKALLDKLSLDPAVASRLRMKFHAVHSEKELFSVLDEIYAEEISKGMSPILHFEAHGKPDYMRLSNEDYVSWHDLGNRLAKFNLASRFNLLVVMACCEGIHQINALTTKDICPFSALVGCQGTIYPSELLDGFEQFYVALLADGSGERAIERLQSAVVKSKDTEFRLFTCEFAFRSVYLKVLAENNDPANKSKQIEKFKKEMDRIKALHGNLVPTSADEIIPVIAAANERVFRGFHSTFFALREIPENENRYRFETLTK